MGRRLRALWSALWLLSVPVMAGESGPTNDLPVKVLSAWTSSSENLATLGQGRVQWPKAEQIEGFLPLGFSADGWLAWTHRVPVGRLEDPQGECTGDRPCFDISLINVLCADRCQGDMDPDAGRQCRCPRGAEAETLKSWDVRPGEYQAGELPIGISGRLYDVELTLRENALPSRIQGSHPGRVFPATDVFLTQGDDRRLLLSIDHNQSAIGTNIRVAGFIKHPQGNAFFILLLIHRVWAESQGSPAYALMPIPVPLGSESSGIIN